MILLERRVQDYSQLKMPNNIQSQVLYFIPDS